MTLFDNQFYPTPKSLAEKILKDIDWKYIYNVLEPSAGAGDLAEVAWQNMKDAHTTRWNSSYIPEIDCIEVNPDLRSIIKGKGKYNIVHDNFLTFESYKKYSLILMNPPFKNGTEHMLKAIELQNTGGSIICILNAQTLRTAPTNGRKTLLQKLTELNAEIEYMQSEFKQAERKTNVEIAVIKIFIPDKQKDSLILSDLKRAKEIKEKDNRSTDLIEDDYIKQAVTLFNFEVEVGLKLIDEYDAALPYISDSFTEKNNHPIIKLTFNDYHNPDANPNEYIKKVRKKYWENLFTNPKFTKNFTSNLLDKCRKEVDKLENYDFTEYNITEIRAELTKDIIKGMEDTIMDLFDTLTHKYHYHEDTEKNIHYYNGWKSNKAWKIGKKSILPFDLYSYISDSMFSYSRKDIEKLEDIIKAMDYLDGKTKTKINLLEEINFAKDIGKTKDILIEGYFTINCYKKGTTHLIYENMDLINRLNRYAGLNKSWLPPGYGKKEYNDLNEEEKETINSFEGKDEYNKVMSDTNTYLPQTTNILMIGE